MILNQIALNPTVHYQSLAQHVQQQLPTLMIPVFKLDPTSASRAVEELPLDHEKSSEYIELHTLVDYQPWLKHLYRQWQEALIKSFTHLEGVKGLAEPDHWHPESTARAMNALALSYTGKLIYLLKQDPITVVDRTTLLWRDTWQNFRHELEHQQTKLPVLQALDNTAHYFQQFWLESWLHIAELQSTLPSNPTENNNKAS
ncbi:MAG TPA: hypothetical protein PK283_08535 [Thiotrichales bacterium]|nr:MAG: hypothetical protein B7Y68_04915 [Thiotrichales bacterium 35-46-9]HQR82939.1 hypothetical protein [Thiotrichales bacterium]